MAPGLLTGARKRGSSVLLGAAFAVCAAPCIGTVLASILVLAGDTGTMVTITRREDSPYYHVDYGTTPLERIANVERLLDDDMIDTTGHDVTPTFAAWARPLIGVPFTPYEVLA